MKKKIGTVMEETLLFGAKKAALEKHIPFSRFIELAVEDFLLREKAGRRPLDEIYPSLDVCSPEVREKQRDYVPREGGALQAVGALPGSTLKFSVDSEERRKRAFALSGKFHSGRPDIAEGHDKYAFEASNEPSDEISKERFP
jgi:hypothetical protein